MNMHDYPKGHLVSHIRKVIYLEEKTDKKKLLNFLKGTNFSQCLPPGLDEKEIQWLVDLSRKIKTSENNESADETIFNLVIAVNLYALERPYKLNYKDIAYLCKRFDEGKGRESGGFTIEHLENHELNLKRFEVIKALNDGKIVIIDNKMIHRLNESCRKVDTEHEFGSVLWGLISNYEKIKKYDPRSPEILNRTQTVLTALRQGRRVKVNNHEVIPVMGFQGAFHWQAPACVRYRPITKIVYEDFPIEIF